MGSGAELKQQLIRLTALSAAIWGTVTVLCVMAGPFGTLTSQTVSERAIYWGLVTFASILFGQIVDMLVIRLTRGHAAASIALVPLILALILGPMFWKLCRYFGDGNGPGLGWMMLYVLVGAKAMLMIRMAMRQSARAAVPLPKTMPEAGAAIQPLPRLAVVPAPPPPPEQPRLIARLAPQVRGPVQRLQMRDHYVEVYTDAGHDELLMRFADAIAELEGVEGLRVHRSHWVARRAIVSLTRLGGKTMLALSDGTMVPVSRTYMEAVDDLGLPPRTDPAQAAAE